jgi:hypothetical protein
MPLKFKLQLESDGGNSEVSGEFTDEERDRLRLFVQYSDEVSKTRLVQNGDWGGFEIRYDEKTGYSYKATLPPWDDVIIFLHKFRPLLLETEATSFYKIQSLLGKVLDHPVLRVLLRAQRELYSGKTFQGQVQVLSNSVLLNSDKVLSDWLNAYEYHREKEKREFIDSLHKMIPLDISKAIFLGLLRDKSIAVLNVTEFIKVVQGAQQVLSWGHDD